MIFYYVRIFVYIINRIAFAKLDMLYFSAVVNGFMGGMR